MKAEKIARRNTIQGESSTAESEVTLSEIWTILEKELGLAEGTGIGPGIEQQCERNALYPNQQMLDAIQQDRSDGECIVFVSDMYLPSEFLRDILETHSIINQADHLFVSCDYRKTKHHGDLYEVVMATLGGVGSDYRMTGDNRHSDYRMPRKLGWRSTHYRGHKFNAYEQSIASRSGDSRMQKSFVAGQLKAARLGVPVEGHGSRLVGDFLGLAAFSWALWAIRKAEQEGVSRLYFMARDGHLAWVCAKAIQDAGLTNVDCRYFYGSRFAFFYANICSLDQDLKWIFSQTKKLSWPKLLRYLKLEESDLTEPFLKACERFDRNHCLTRSEFDSLVGLLKDSPEGQFVLERAQASRELILEYFNQEGITADGNGAFVDIGWHLNVQSAIKRLIPTCNISGFYVYLSEDRIPPVAAGSAETMLELVAADIKTRNIPQVWHVSTVAEHLFGITTEGTTIGYERNQEDRVVPVLQPMEFSEAAAKQPLIDEVRSYAESIALDATSIFDTPSSCAQAFLGLTNVFFETPTKPAVRKLNEAIRISSDAQNEDNRPMVSAFGLKDMLSLAAIAAGGDRDARFDWLSAKLTISHWPINYANAALRLLRRYL